MAEIIDEAGRREQALQLERIRLAARKAGRASEIDSAATLTWERLGIPHDTITQIRKILSDIVLAVLKKTKGQTLPPDLLAALGTVKDSLSGSPVPALPSATRSLLLATLGSETSGTEAAAAVRDLYSAGLEVVPSALIPTIRCLAATEPSLSDVPIMQSRLGQEWRFFADAALVSLGHPPLDPEQLTSLLWRPQGLVDPGQSGIHRWVAFLHAYELTLCHDFGRAWGQLGLFGKPPFVMTPIEKEVVNLRAYLLLLKHGDEGASGASTLLDTIRRSPVASKNYELLAARARLTRNERGPAENPYLALGVAHGAPRETWRAAWMAIRAANKDDLETLSAANEARDRIVELEKEERAGLGGVFVTPLDGRFVVGLPRYGEPSHADPSGLAEVMRLAALSEMLKSIL